MTDYSHYNQYDNESVASYFITDILMNPSNIEEYYNNDYNEYKEALFIGKCGSANCGCLGCENYNNFISMTHQCNFDYNHILTGIV